ncbi:MAG TPA: hypothetical protein VFP13_03510, partial [Actinomycetota bacterium]|nr:hypothetical protein [Actinomycetota bacterium]
MFDGRREQRDTAVDGDEEAKRRFRRGRGRPQEPPEDAGRDPRPAPAQRGRIWHKFAAIALVVLVPIGVATYYL